MWGRYKNYKDPMYIRWDMSKTKFKCKVFYQHPLPSKFGKNRVSYSWEIADIELAVVVGDGGGVQSHFHVKPNFELSWGSDNRCSQMLKNHNTVVVSVHPNPTHRPSVPEWV